MAEIDKRVGERCRELRKLRQIKQADLAKAMNITAARLSQLEQGESWSLAMVAAAADGLRVRVFDMLPDPLA